MDSFEIDSDTKGNDAISALIKQINWVCWSLCGNEWINEKAYKT